MHRLNTLLQCTENIVHCRFKNRVIIVFSWFKRGGSAHSLLGRFSFFDRESFCCKQSWRWAHLMTNLWNVLCVMRSVGSRWRWHALTASVALVSESCGADLRLDLITAPSVDTSTRVCRTILTERQHLQPHQTHVRSQNKCWLCWPWTCVCYYYIARVSYSWPQSMLVT